MGGGAGIRFSLKINSFAFNTKRGEVNPIKPVTIQNWSALGHMDGMDNIRGDLLKVKRVEYILEQDERAELKKDDIRASDTLWANSFVAENVEFAGYVRGKWTDIFPMWLTGETYLEGIGTCEISVLVQVADKREFAGFWSDVFDYDSAQEDADAYNEENIEEGDAPMTLEQMYEIHNDDCRANYGAK